MARIRLSVELDVEIDPDDGESRDTSDTDLRYAAHEAVTEALEFVYNERGFWNPVKGTDISVHNVKVIE